MLEDVGQFNSAFHHLSQSELNNCIRQATSSPVCLTISASSWSHPIMSTFWEDEVLYNKCFSHAILLEMCIGCNIQSIEDRHTVPQTFLKEIVQLTIYTNLYAAIFFTKQKSRMSEESLHSSQREYM